MSCFRVILAAVLAQIACIRAPWEPGAQDGAAVRLGVEVSFGADVHDGPLTGRLFLALSSSADPEPRIAAYNSARQRDGRVPFFAADVGPGEPMFIDAAADGYPSCSATTSSPVRSRSCISRSFAALACTNPRDTVGCLRCLLLVMCAHPFAKKALTLHLARSEGHERYFGCNSMHRKVLASSHQHLMAEAPYHSCRTHLSLEKDAPEPRRVESPAMGKVSAISKVGGLHHYYTRRAA